MYSPATVRIMNSYRDSGLPAAMRELSKLIRGADDIASDIVGIAEEIEQVQSSTLLQRVAAAIDPSIDADPNLYIDHSRRAINELSAYFMEKGNVSIALALKAASIRESAID